MMKPLVVPTAKQSRRWVKERWRTVGGEVGLRFLEFKMVVMAEVVGVDDMVNRIFAFDYDFCAIYTRRI